MRAKHVTREKRVTRVVERKPTRAELAVADFHRSIRDLSTSELDYRHDQLEDMLDHIDDKIDSLRESLRQIVADRAEYGRRHAVTRQMLADRRTEFTAK